MANIKIADLPEITSLNSSDVLPSVDVGGNTTYKVTVQNLASSLTQVSSSISASYSVSASLSITSSYATNALSASFITGSKVFGPLGSNSILSSSMAITASYALTASFITGSRVFGPLGSNSILSSSTAVTASYALTARIFPFTGSAIISGSLRVIGRTNLGENASATGLNSTAQGAGIANGEGSYAQGGATADGIYSHAEGNTTVASGYAAHSEGYETLAAGSSAHAEGSNTYALGTAAHAEGYFTTASANYSHAEGNWTVASGQYQLTVGQFNRSSSAESAFIVGNGTSNSNRSNLIFASGSQMQVTGSVISTQGFTGSLFGTASWAQNSYTASFLNPLNQNLAITGSLVVSGANGAGVFSQGATLVDYVSGISNSGSYMVWRAPFSCSAVALYGWREGGGAAEVNAQKSGSAGLARLTGSNITLTNEITWTAANTLQNQNFNPGDSLKVIISGSSANNQVAVQVDFIRRF